MDDAPEDISDKISSVRAELVKLSGQKSSPQHEALLCILRDELKTLVRIRSDIRTAERQKKTQHL